MTEETTRSCLSKMLQTLARLEERLNGHADTMENFTKFEETRHTELDNRMEKLEKRIWQGILAMLALLITIVGYLLVNGRPWIAEAHAEEMFQSLSMICTQDAPSVRQQFEKFGESMMLSNVGPDMAVELWTNPDTGSWSLAIRYPNGTICVPMVGAEPWTRHAQGKNL